MPLESATKVPDFSGVDGFLGTRGSLMLDVVFVAMFLVVPGLAFSIYLVRYRRNYVWHKRLQLALAGVLAVAVLAFEVDMRFWTDWQQRAEPSPYFARGTWNAVWASLIVHLAFAIPTLVLWIMVVVRAWRAFPNPPAPGRHSAAHRRWAWLGSGGMLLTAVTGWIFYWLAFVA